MTRASRQLTLRQSRQCLGKEKTIPNCPACRPSVRWPNAIREPSDGKAMSTSIAVNTAGRAGPVYGAIEDKLSLSELLAAATKDLQEQAANSPFLKDFLRGRVPAELFKLGVAALYHIYAAAEGELERNKGHRQLAPLYFPAELHRREALSHDLEHFYGAGWQRRLACSPATKRYVDRIRQVGRKNPVLLVAHAYTCYMGGLCGGQLLSGGRVLSNVARRNLNLPATGEGLEFYHFAAIDSPLAFKQLYRSRLNELVLDIGSRQRLVAEATQALRFNMDVLKELEEFGMTIQKEEEEKAVLDAAAAATGPPITCEATEGGGIGGTFVVLAFLVGTVGVCQLLMDRLCILDVLFTACLTTLGGLATWYLM